MGMEFFDDVDEDDDEEDAFEEVDDFLEVIGSLVSDIFAANRKNYLKKKMGNYTYLDLTSVRMKN